MKVEDFFNIINKPLVYDNKFVISCMKSWEEYVQVGRLLYSYDKNLNQDDLGVFSMEDFESFILEQHLKDQK